MIFKIRQYNKWTAVSMMMEDAALKIAVVAAVKAALVPVNAELARVSEQLALVVSDNAELKERVEIDNAELLKELKERVEMLEEDICVLFNQ
jgi:hypothetical protein